MKEEAMADIPSTENVEVAMIAAALRLAGEMERKVGSAYWAGDDEERRQKVMKDFEDAYKAVRRAVRPSGKGVL